MKKILALFLSALLVVCALVSCSAGEQGKNTTLPATTEEKADPVIVRLMALQGPTGLGLAPLLHRAGLGMDVGLNLEGSIVSSAEISNIAAAIANGSCDIAAVPINLAAQLYKKTGGNVRILCANTLGVLSVLENGDTVKSLADLDGKTLYATGQGSTPEYILRGLLKKAGLEDRVNVEFVADHTELAARMAQGQAGLGMLPEPNVTVVLSSNSSFRKALDLTEEWNQAFGGVELIQGVYIARADFAEEHPEAVEAFLKAYEQSQSEVLADPETAAGYVVEQGILPLPNEKVIAKAIPGAHITYLAGEKMKESVSACLQVLLEVEPASIGGSLPDEAIYWIK